MKRIVHYHTLIFNFIVTVSLFVIICILGVQLWKKYINKKIEFKFGVKDVENFSQISLEKKVTLYDDYRNYIDGKNHLLSRYSKRRQIPYVVSPGCFAHKFGECMESKELQRNPYVGVYPEGFKITSRKCQEESINQCLTDNLYLLNL
tara:strand:- start:263 stop:706 length:444 start_codon:yes stop_codon:yes gene_type:complete